jgi:SsrA-binding protein
LKPIQPQSEAVKVLLKKELKGLLKVFKAKGLTIVPLKLFTNEKLAKLQIGLCKERKPTTNANP